LSILLSSINASDRSDIFGIVPIQQIEEAYERTIKGDVRYRFVIDMNSLKNES
jgi:D-arabinose 1-dehydrogenase-like Zn-dependent alcohol dehydrogenase